MTVVTLLLLLVLMGAPLFLVASNYRIRAIFKRNFVSYFSGVLGYLFIVVFVGLGAFAAFRPEFFANNLANLDQLNAFFPLLLLFIVPAVAMTSWADERRAGTDELLFTLPATDLEILLGKYLAVLAIYTVALLYSMLFCALGVLLYLSHMDLDFGLILTNYLGYWLAGAALLTAGMLASQLTTSVTVAFIIGTALCALPVVAFSTFEWLMPNSRFLQMLSVQDHLRDFGLGMIPLSGLLYFISVGAFMLYLNVVFLSQRHWAGGPHREPMALHFATRTLCLAVALISLNIIAANASTRLDLTSERLYSVFPTTRETIQRIDANRPVTIQAFISPNVPRDYVVTRSNLIGLLRQYDQIGGSRITVRFVDTEPYTDAADQAQRFGILPQVVQIQTGGKISQQPVYLGAVVSAGTDDEVVIPFFDVGTPVEYELTRSIQTIQQEKRLKVGVLNTDARIFGGFDMATFSSTREWRIITELKKQYDVEQVAPDAPITGTYDVLIAPMPSSLTDPQLTVLTDYVKAGHPTLIFDDPFPMFKTSLAPRQPKPTHGGGMFGQQQQPPAPKADDGTAARLLSVLGLAWDNGEIAWDTYNPHPEFADGVPPEYIFVGAESGSSAPFGSKSNISSNLQELVLLFSGRLRPREDATGLDFIPLLRTSPASGVLAWEDAIEESPGMMMGMGGGGIMPKQDILHEKGKSEHVLAAHIVSKSKTKEGRPSGINVVFVADLDMVSDLFFNLRDRDMGNLRLDNVTFVLNAVDALAGKTSLIDLRKRRARHRTLKAVEEFRNTYYLARNEERTKADADAKVQMEEATQRFKDAREQIAKDTSLSADAKRIKLTTVLEHEARRVAVDKARIENDKQKRIQDFKAKSEREIRSMEGLIQTWAIILPPIPALVVGMFVFFSGLAAERRSIHSDRLVSR